MEKPERNLLRTFWGCGDDGIIEYAMHRARLTKPEKEVLLRLLDECETQEEAAEHMDLSTRRIQEIWYAASDKLLRLPWLVAYAKELRKE